MLSSVSRVKAAMSSLKECVNERDVFWNKIHSRDSVYAEVIAYHRNVVATLQDKSSHTTLNMKQREELLFAEESLALGFAKAHHRANQRRLQNKIDIGIELTEIEAADLRFSEAYLGKASSMQAPCRFFNTLKINKIEEEADYVFVSKIEDEEYFLVPKNETADLNSFHK